MTKLTARLGVLTVCVFATLTLVCVADGHVLAQANELILGSWLLDRAQSTFSGAPPDRRTTKFEKLADGGIRHVTDTSTTGGFLEDAYRLQYTFKMDGKEYAADPQMPVNTVAFKKVNPTTYVRTGKYQGNTVETVTYTVSADGKVLTATQQGTLNGVEVNSVQVFIRQ